MNSIYDHTVCEIENFILAFRLSLDVRGSLGSSFHHSVCAIFNFNFLSLHCDISFGFFLSNFFLRILLDFSFQRLFSHLYFLYCCNPITLHLSRIQLFLPGMCYLYTECPYAADMEKTISAELSQCTDSTPAP